MTCPTTPSVGAYALDLLEPANRARLEEHLAGCAECRTALDELTPLVPLLARAHPVVPDESGYERLHAAVAARSRRTRVRWALAAAAVLLAVLAGAALLVGGHERSTTTVSATAGTVHAQAAVTDSASGSRIRLQLSGVEARERCQLVAVARDGHREVASTWMAGYAGTATVTGGVSLSDEQIDRLVVETLDGQQLVALPLHG